MLIQDHDDACLEPLDSRQVDNGGVGNTTAPPRACTKAVFK
jgi:hypothetical protein